MKLSKSLFIASVAILAALLSACAGAASAQDATEVQASAQTSMGVVNAQAQPASGLSAQEKGPGGPDLTTAAEALGVTVEELQQALQDAKPAECADQGSQPVSGVNCRPDIEAAAEALGVTVEELQSALGRPQGGQGGGNLEDLAESLGVTVEELQQAFQDARPAECADQSGQPANGTDCRPDLDAVAESLGITAEELQTALEENHPGGPNNLEDASVALGVTVEELQQALQDARPDECTGQPGDGPNCRPDLNVVAESLGITTEELQDALGKPGHGQGGGPGNGQQDGPGNGGPGNGGPGNGGPGGPGGNGP